MASTRITIIRHGEKPDDQSAPPISVLTAGDKGVNNLDTRGWQRAGALVRFFAPHGGDHADRPAALFAAQAGGPFTSLRTQQTIQPLAEFLGTYDPAEDETVPMPITAPALPDDVVTAATAILKGESPILVCWEHKNIAKLVAAITGNVTLAPHWSGNRFDMALVLEQHHGAWSLTQRPQLLLAGDSSKPLRARKEKDGVTEDR